jgi:hypothetical protein
VHARFVLDVDPQAEIGEQRANPLGMASFCLCGEIAAIEVDEIDIGDAVRGRQPERIVPTVWARQPATSQQSGRSICGQRSTIVATIGLRARISCSRFSCPLTLTSP